MNDNDDLVIKVGYGVLGDNNQSNLSSAGIPTNAIVSNEDCEILTSFATKCNMEPNAYPSQTMNTIVKRTIEVLTEEQSERVRKEILSVIDLPRMIQSVMDIFNQKFGRSRLVDFPENNAIVLAAKSVFENYCDSVVLYLLTDVTKAKSKNLVKKMMDSIWKVF